ncbi:MAG: FAD-binding oxidoreductase [Candidatus Lokiarchaeota archaeon]|nr:FAD-binding oxidoreductase [Candidatus Lokiarchaeota archaeon]
MNSSILIKDLQNRLPWEKFIDSMEREGFLKLTHIKTSKVSESKFNYQSIQSGSVMLVGDPIQASVIRDTSHLHIRPYVLFRPKVESQLRVILKNSQKFNIPITFAGGKTGLSGGYSNYGIIIDMIDFQSYKEPFRYDFKNNTVRVNQNVLVSDLIKYTLLRSDNKFIFPVQPASSYKLPVRVGGLIASNASGITSGKLGSVENWVETIRIMKPDGAMAEIDRNNPLFLKIIGGNGYFGVILSATFKLYRPETDLKHAILYGYNITHAFNGLQSILDSKIFPLVSEFVISDQKLPGKFNELGEENTEDKHIKWAVLIKGSANLVDKFIDSMKNEACCDWNILSEEEFQEYLQERSAFALIIQSEDRTSDFIAFPGFEDILSEPKNLPEVIEMINDIFTKNGFHKVIFGYGHINFRKGQGLLLHMRLPVPIDFFYKENQEKLRVICETVYSVILNLFSKFKIKHKAEHSPGPFKIWLDPIFRRYLREKVIKGEAFTNPHLMIFDELFIRKFKSSISSLSNADNDDFLSVEDKKYLFVSAMTLYLSGE